MTLSIIAGILNCRIRAKKQGFNATAGTTTFFFLLISILFLAFDWNKLHIIWVLPITLFTIPFLITKSIPVLSPIALSATRVFLKIILVGIKPKIIDENIGTDEIVETDEDDNKAVTLQLHKVSEIQKPRNERIEQYKKIRPIARSLTDTIMKHAPKFILVRAVSDLNMRGPKGIFIFDSEQETNYLMDRCFYDIYWENRNLIQHFIDTDDYKQLSEEVKTIVNGMTTTYYSLFEIAGINPREATVQLKDLLGDMTYTITDLSMSHTARQGNLIATRIKQIEGIYMMTGAACPFEAEHKEVLLTGLMARKTVVKKGKKRKLHGLQKTDYSAYFFKQYKRISGIKFVTFEGEEGQ